MGRPKGAKEVPKERKTVIMNMTAIGVKQKDIVQHYSMPQSAVSNVIRRMRASNGNNEIETRGRKQKLSARRVRMLLKCSKKHRSKSISTITAEFNKGREEFISVSTVRRMQHENGIQNYVAATKPFSLSINMKKHMKWARKHAFWSDAQWDRVIFSDETSVTVRPKMQRKQVWRMEGQRYMTSNLVPSFTSGYVGVSIWATFSTRRRTSLVLISGTLNKEK